MTKLFTFDRGVSVHIIIEDKSVSYNKMLGENHI